MNTTHTATVSITLKASPAQVWAALTTPELIKQYFFGVDVETDWHVGSPIVYRGTWDGKPFADKGTVLAVAPEKELVCHYWTSFSGLPDTPENYQTITYALTPGPETTTLTITQENIPTEDARQHSEQNWHLVLDNLKKLLERVS